MTNLNTFKILILSLSLVTWGNTSLGQSKQSAPVTKDAKTNPVRNKRVQLYMLENVEVIGTTRMTTEEVSHELGLQKGIALDDDLVMNARSSLLSLGLFKSVILIMRKGTSPGYATLIIEVEDDKGVLSDWAIGSDLGVTLSEDNASANASHTDSAPMSYHLGLVGRNLFGALHRGSVNVDIDSKGFFREGQIAYGFPRFTKEGTQFDAEIAAINVRYRYLSAFGFGGRGQGLWSHSVGDFGELEYGAAMYINQTPEYAVPGFPTSVAGPKVIYSQETRLRGFFPGSGYYWGASLLFSPMQTGDSVIEIHGAKTWAIHQIAYLTFDSKILAVGTKGYSVRGESRFDFPLGIAQKNEDQAEIFLRLRGGQDRVGDTNLVGSAGLIGIRYHSPGFIAEVAFKIIRSPEEFLNDASRSTGDGL